MVDLILKRNTTTNKERSAAHSKQVLIALRLYATGTFQRVNYLRAACTIIHKVSRAISEQKGQLLSPPGTWLMRMLRTFYFSIFSHFSLSAALLKLTEVAFDIATVRFLGAKFS